MESIGGTVHCNYKTQVVTVARLDDDKSRF